LRRPDAVRVLAQGAAVKCRHGTEDKATCGLCRRGEEARQIWVRNWQRRKQADARLKRPRCRATGELSGEMLRQVRALAPGEALELTAAERQLVILDADDFTHILELAGMRTKAPA
jgi:hypothetical protein